MSYSQHLLRRLRSRNATTSVLNCSVRTLVITVKLALVDCCSLSGDAFLKYVASTYLFVTMPAAGEGDLHMVRQDIISNKSLLQCANKLNLPTYIHSKPFVTKVWEPVAPPAPVTPEGSGAQQAPSEPPTPTKSTENGGESTVGVHTF